MPKWTVLDAISATASSWKKVTSENIAKCFEKAWTRSDEAAQTVADDEMVPVTAEWETLQSLTNISVEFNEYVGVDDDLATVLNEDLTTGLMQDQGSGVSQTNTTPAFNLNDLNDLGFISESFNRRIQSILVKSENR
ncbi:unnamed protein product [Parnassius apollo]|uniref:(apollo) hypothetical protein n=1 Tax=Parnassius apollo TaxID=110799 RepID=A0A8S3WCF8_PARAO|nr:unnamed protein product [Parnassius apollo]